MKQFVFFIIVAFGICVISCNGNGKSNGKESDSVLEDSLQKISNDIDSKEVVLSIELNNMDSLGEYASFGKEISIKINDEDDSDSIDSTEVNLLVSLTLNVHTAVCSTDQFSYNFSVVDKNSDEIADLGLHHLNHKFIIGDDEDEFRNYINKGESVNEWKIDGVGLAVTKEQWSKIVKDGVSVIVEPEYSNQHMEKFEQFKKPQYKPFVKSDK